MGDPPDHARMRRLLDVGRTLVSELDSDKVLDRVLETARDVTNARYAALGLLDSQRAGLERFITRGSTIRRAKPSAIRPGAVVSWEC